MEQDIRKEGKLAALQYPGKKKIIARIRAKSVRLSRKSCLQGTNLTRIW